MPAVRKSRFKGYLQIFSPLLASWSGKRDLMNLNHLELIGLPYQLTGEPLLCAFYLNELLLRLLPKDDPYPEIFTDYQETLKALEFPVNGVAPILRRFEKRLLDHLGYGLSFHVNLRKNLINGCLNKDFSVVIQQLFMQTD